MPLFHYVLAKNKIVLSEEQLVDALRNRQRIGMEQLYDRYSAALFGVIIRIVQTEEIAEDVLQDAFVKIWDSFGSYDASKGRLFTWMVNLCRNLAIDKVRSKDFRNHSKNQDIEDNVTAIDSFKNNTYKPETIGMKELVETLKPEQKTLIDLVYFKGYTHVEAAEHLDIPLGTVKTRIRMSIIELRKFFN